MFAAHRLKLCLTTLWKCFGEQPFCYKIRSTSLAQGQVSSDELLQLLPHLDYRNQLVSGDFQNLFTLAVPQGKLETPLSSSFHRHLPATTYLSQDFDETSFNKRKIFL